MNFDSVHVESVSSIAAAASLGLVNRVRELIAEGKPCDKTDNKGWMSLQHAAFNGQLECVQLILEEGSCDLNWKTWDDSTALKLACSKLPDTEAVVRFLLNEKADVSIGDNDLNTPLHFAADRGHLKAVKWLVRCGADVNAVNVIKERSVLHYAVGKRTRDGREKDEYIEILKYLLKKQANVHILDCNQMNALHLAIDRHRYGSATTIISSVANEQEQTDLINKKCKRYSPLAMTCRNFLVSYDFVELLVKNGADCEVEENSGPHQPILSLHGACCNRSGARKSPKDLYKIVKLLLSRLSNSKLVEQYSNDINECESLFDLLDQKIHPLFCALQSDELAETAALAILEERESPWNRNQLMRLSCDCHQMQYLPESWGYPCTPLHQVNYTMQSAFSYNLAKLANKKRLKLFEMMVELGWDVNSGQSDRVIPPLTAFLIGTRMHSTLVGKVDLECCARVLEIMSMKGARFADKDMTLLILHSKPELLIMASHHGLFHPETVCKLNLMTILDLISTIDEGEWSFLNSLLSFLALINITGCPTANFRRISKNIINFLKEKQREKCEEKLSDLYQHCHIDHSIPRTLSTLSRNCVREAMFNVDSLNRTNVDKLKLPNVLKEFILLSELKQFLGYLAFICSRF